MIDYGGLLKPGIIIDTNQFGVAMLRGPDRNHGQVPQEWRGIRRSIFQESDILLNGEPDCIINFGTRPYPPEEADQQMREMLRKELRRP